MCVMRKINNDIEFSYLFEKLLEKRSKLITNKLSRKLTEIKNTKTETLSKVLEPKHFSELIVTENKIPQNPSPIIEILNISFDIEPEGNSSNVIPDKVSLSNIEIYNISSIYHQSINIYQYIIRFRV